MSDDGLLLNHLTSVVTTNGVQVESLVQNEGRITEAWMKCPEGRHVSAVYFWHTERWSVKTEELMNAVLRRVANTSSHRGVIACGANTEPTEFKLGDWYRR